MQDLLYQFFGSTCEISFPTNCKVCGGTTITNPSITGFRLVPNTTNYVGTQNVTFTGASLTINKGTHIQENSLKIYWGTDILAEGLSVNVDTVTFDIPIMKGLVEGNSYTAKASVLDTEGNEYYSNTFTITVQAPVQLAYMYTGNSTSKPIASDILASTKYLFDTTKQFNTPAMMLNTIWICIPATVTLVSMENVNFSGDYIYNVDTGRDYMQHEDITLDGVAYKLIYLTTIASHNPYKTIVR